jgi:hypothetical protein
LKLKRFSILCMLGLATTSGLTSIAAATPNPPDIDPARFPGGTITNTYFPLVPGTTFYYVGEKDRIPNSNVTEVTCDTKVILGVTTTVVHDRAYDENGKVVEDTFDWYAQDMDGNVWYFGEDTKELDPSTGEVVSTEGSWEAGVDDADAGIIMEAHPRPGDRYYQEFAPGVAEDQAQVQSLDESSCTQQGCFAHLLRTKEITQLSPGEVENKYYRVGVGFIFGEIVKGGDEHTELVSVSTTHKHCH